MNSNSWRFKTGEIQSWSPSDTPATIIILSAFLKFRLNVSKKENVIKTLSHNERKIVWNLINNKGQMRRNQLERETKMAKSSLANTLNNLEKTGQALWHESYSQRP